MIEILPFCYLAAYLLFSNTFYGAILIYALYQIGFIFGDYLSRNETLIFHTKDYLSKIDKTRQIGYLSGLSLAFIFYFILEKFKSWAKKLPLLIIEDSYTLDYLKELTNKKELIYPYLNMEHSYDVFNTIMKKYNLEPSNHIVDLLYEALIYESNNKN